MRWIQKAMLIGVLLVLAGCQCPPARYWQKYRCVKAPCPGTLVQLVCELRPAKR